MGQQKEVKTPLLSNQRSHAPTTPDSLPPPADSLQSPAPSSTGLAYEEATPSAPVMTSIPPGYSEHIAYYIAPDQQGQIPSIHAYPLGGRPERMMCPRCGTQALSIIDKETGACTWLSSFMLCFLGCCWISWIPFCLDVAKDTVHRCPNCQAILGRIRP